MQEARTTSLFSGRSIIVFSLLATLLSACGLGLDLEGRLARAEQAFGDGEYRAVIIDAKNILVEDPDNVTARLLLGRASIETGDGISAEKELRKAIELGADPASVVPDLGRALLLQGKFGEILAEIDAASAGTSAGRLVVGQTRGEALIGLQRPAAAREEFASVLSADAENLAARLGIVKTYIAERNFLQARDLLDHVLADDPLHVPSWLMSGSLNMQGRNAVQAESDYSEAAKLAGDSGSTAQAMIALTGLVDASLTQEKVDVARRAVARMQELAPGDPRTMLVTARLASIDADWDAAQTILQDILRRTPDFRPAQMLLGYVHKESGDLGQAEMYLSAAVAAVPSDSTARRLLAETRLQLNKAGEAREALGPLAVGPDADPGMLSLAAASSLSLGDFSDAISLLEPAVAAEPDNAQLRIQLAFAYLQSDDPVKAQEILEALPATVAGDDEFRRNSLLVLTLMGQGQRVDALGLARELASRWPGRADAHGLVGSIEMSSGDLAAARKSFASASKLEPDNVQTIRYLARLDELAQDQDSAASRYRVILELQPNDAASMIALAKISARNEDYAMAREWLEKARSADLKSAVLSELLGALHLIFKEFDEAETVLSEGLRLDAENSALLSMMGHVKLNQKDFDAAESMFDRALQIEPREPLHRLNLARVHSVAGDTAAAHETLTGSLPQVMQHIPSAVFLASLKADAGDIDGAKAIARELRQRYPNESLPYSLDAELKSKSGNLIEAAAAFDGALAIEKTRRNAIRAFQTRVSAGLDEKVEPLVDYLAERPLDSGMRIYLAQAYEGMQKPDDANAQYERVLAYEPDNFIAANNLAWNYFTNDDPRAERLARLAYTMQPENGAVADTLGWILVNTGALKEGISILRRASTLSGGAAEVRYHLAAGLAATGETKEAKTILQDILATADEFSSRQGAQELFSEL